MLNWVIVLIYSDTLIFHLIGVYGIKYIIYGLPLSFGIAILLVFIVSKTIKDPLIESIDCVNNIVQRNLSIKIRELNTKSEQGILNKALIQLDDSLTNIVGEIKKL